jgi:hypothetical protein
MALQNEKAALNNAAFNLRLFKWTNLLRPVFRV